MKHVMVVKIVTQQLPHFSTEGGAFWGISRSGRLSQSHRGVWSLLQVLLVSFLVLGWIGTRKVANWFYSMVLSPDLAALKAVKSPSAWAPGTSPWLGWGVPIPQALVRAMEKLALL